MFYDSSQNVHRGFETSRDLVVNRLSTLRIEALVVIILQKDTDERGPLKSNLSHVGKTKLFDMLHNYSDIWSPLPGPYTYKAIIDLFYKPQQRKIAMFQRKNCSTHAKNDLNGWSSGTIQSWFSESTIWLRSICHYFTPS